MGEVCQLPRVLCIGNRTAPKTSRHQFQPGDLKARSGKRSEEYPRPQTCQEPGRAKPPGSSPGGLRAAVRRLKLLAAVRFCARTSSRSWPTLLPVRRKPKGAGPAHAGELHSCVRVPLSSARAEMPDFWGTLCRFVRLFGMSRQCRPQHPGGCCRRCRCPPRRVIGPSISSLTSQSPATRQPVGTT